MGRCDVGEFIIEIFLGEKSNFLGEELFVDGAILFRCDTPILVGEHGYPACVDGMSSLDACRLEILIAASWFSTFPLFSSISKIRRLTDVNGLDRQGFVMSVDA